MSANYPRIAIFGRSQSGKSTRARELLESADRVIIYDTLHEYSSPYQVVRSIPELVRSISRHLQIGKYKIALQPSANANHLEQVSLLSRTLFELQEGFKTGLHALDVWLLVEEMSVSVPNVRSRENQAFVNLVNMGRHYGVSIIGTSQRPAEVSTNFRGNATDTYIFGLSDACDYDAIAAKVGRDWAAKLKSMKTHEYLHHHDGEVVTGKNKFPGL